jgi:hypothetical protein
MKEKPKNKGESLVRPAGFEPTTQEFLYDK